MIKRIAKYILYVCGLIFVISAMIPVVQFIFPTSTQQLPYIYHGHSGSIGELAWSADGKRITSWSSDGTVQTWDAFSGNNEQIRHYHDAFLFGNVREIPSPNGKYIASWIQPPEVAQLDRVIVWDALTDKILATYVKPEILAMAWSPDSKYIASSSNMLIDVWESTTGKRTITYDGHYDELNCHHCTTVADIAWSPDGTRIASTGYDGRVLIWDVATGKTDVTYNCKCFAGRITWSLPDESRIIVSGSISKGNNSPDYAEIQLLQLTYAYGIDITKRVTISCPPSPSTLVGTGIIWEASPNNKYLAYVCLDSSNISSRVNIWDTTNMRVVLTYQVHIGEVSAMAWSPDSRYIASGDVKGLAEVWQVNQ